MKKIMMRGFIITYIDNQGKRLEQFVKAWHSTEAQEVLRDHCKVSEIIQIRDA